MKYLVLSLLAIVLSACGGSSTEPRVNNGPLNLGIVAGQNQIAKAGSTKLTDPVVGQLVRLPNGTMAFNWDVFLPKKAYAQTEVKGSPVPGAVVCAKPMTAGQMEPFVPCTNTDAEGKAVFFFTPGTKAGPQEAEIRGTLAGAPAVFDTAKAVVTAGDPTELMMTYIDGRPNRNAAPGEVLDIHRLILFVRDRYENLIAPATHAEVSHAVGLPAYVDATITPEYKIEGGAAVRGWSLEAPKELGQYSVQLSVGAATSQFFLIVK